MANPTFHIKINDYFYGEMNLFSVNNVNEQTRETQNILPHIYRFAYPPYEGIHFTKNKINKAVHKQFDRPGNCISIDDEPILHQPVAQLLNGEHNLIIPPCSCGKLHDKEQLENWAATCFEQHQDLSCTLCRGVIVRYQDMLNLPVHHQGNFFIRIYYQIRTAMDSWIEIIKNISQIFSYLTIVWAKDILIGELSLALIAFILRSSSYFFLSNFIFVSVIGFFIINMIVLWMCGFLHNPTINVISTPGLFLFFFVFQIVIDWQTLLYQENFQNRLLHLL